MHVNNNKKDNVVVLKDSILLYGHVKTAHSDLEMTDNSTRSIISTMSTTFKEPHIKLVFPPQHVMHQVKSEEVQKLAINANNKLSHHVHVLKDSIQLTGNV